MRKLITARARKNKRTARKDHSIPLAVTDIALQRENKNEKRKKEVITEDIRIWSPSQVGMPPNIEQSLTLLGGRDVVRWVLYKKR